MKCIQCEEIQEKAFAAEIQDLTKELFWASLVFRNISINRCHVNSGGK